MSISHLSCTAQIIFTILNMKHFVSILGLILEKTFTGSAILKFPCFYHDPVKGLVDEIESKIPKL